MSGLSLVLPDGRALSLSAGRTLTTGDLWDASDPDAALATVAQHPTDPLVLGLRNLSSRPWSATVVGQPPQPVPPGRSVTLAQGTAIDLGPCRVTIEADAVAGWVLVAAAARLPLGPGAQVLPSALLGARGRRLPVADVVTNPGDPRVLGLRNLTTLPWSGLLADGRPATVEPGRSVRLVVGTRMTVGVIEVAIGETPATPAAGPAVPAVRRAPVATPPLKRLPLPGPTPHAAPNTVAGAAAAVAVSALASTTLWTVLGYPARIIGGLAPSADCTSLRPGTSAMWACSSRVGLLQVAGPVVLVIAGAVFRHPLVRGLASLTARLPAQGRFLAAPVLSTGLFTMAYADIHRNTAGQAGYLPQRAFPAVVGLFVYLLDRTGPALARRGQRLFAARGRLPAWSRVALALAVPLVAAFVLNNQARVSMTAQKEQAVIVLTLLISAVVLVRPGRPSIGRDR